MIVGLKHRLTFGKYTGKRLNEVIRRDPQYVAWAIRNIQWFELSEKAEQKLLHKLT